MADEFDMQWLGEIIDRLSDFDREMNTVVVDSGVCVKGVHERMG